MCFILLRSIALRQQQGVRFTYIPRDLLDMPQDSELGVIRDGDNTFEDVSALLVNEVLREMAEWPVPLNLKTPVLRKKIRS